jgi:hypothetical protein
LTLTSLAASGWVGVVVLLIILLRRQIPMLGMRLVFLVYRTPRVDQNKWLLKEARRNDKVTLARGFWNRASQRRPKATPSPRRIPAPHRVEPAPVTELPGGAKAPGPCRVGADGITHAI